MRGIVTERLPEAFRIASCQVRIVSGHWPRKGKRGRQLPSSAFAFPALVSLGSQDLTAIVVTASLASSVGHDGLTALGANGHAGSRQLPVTATALIATGLRHFTLRNSHG